MHDPGGIYGVAAFANRVPVQASPRGRRLFPCSAVSPWGRAGAQHEGDPHSDGDGEIPLRLACPGRGRRTLDQPTPRGQLLHRSTLPGTRHPHDHEPGPGGYTHPLYRRRTLRHPAGGIHRVLERHARRAERHRRSGHRCRRRSASHHERRLHEPDTRGHRWRSGHTALRGRPGHGAGARQCKFRRGDGSHPRRERLFPRGRGGRLGAALRPGRRH